MKIIAHIHTDFPQKFGLFGNFRSPSGIPGLPRCARRAWGAMSAWACLPLALLFVPTPSAYPVYVWKRLNTHPIWGLSCTYWGWTWQTARRCTISSLISPLQIAGRQPPPALPGKGPLMLWRYAFPRSFSPKFLFDTKTRCLNFLPRTLGHPISRIILGYTAFRLPGWRCASPSAPRP